MRKLYIFGLIALACLIIGLAWAEQITLTTYYPAPYGVYKTLKVLNDNQKILMGNDATNPGIELRDRDNSGNTPYIDFSDDSPVDEDYDARIILMSNDELRIEGANLRVFNNVAECRGLTVHGNTITICDD